MSIGRLASRVALAGVVAVVLTGDPTTAQDSRLARIRQRGTLVCGVAPGVTGFSKVDGQGRYSGLDVDVCRAVAAAIFGNPDQVRFERADSVDQFQGNADIDLVSRRLTWSLQREGKGLLFGPVIFYDGQSFLVPLARKNQKVADLANARICVVPSGLNEANLTSYFRLHNLTLQKVLTKTDQVEADLSGGRCDAFTADLSELGSLRSAMRQPQAFEILPEQISNEPLAQLVRATDVDLFEVLRWTIIAMISAEELNVTSQNAADMTRSTNPDVRLLLGVNPGNGQALGLAETWAFNVVRAVGNYGEVYERNVGMAGPVRLPRGVNALRSQGGLMYAPPLK